MLNEALVSTLVNHLERDEGVKLAPYHDTVGKLTIGVGRNLDDVGISNEEARFLLMNDIKRTVKELNTSLAWWDGLPDNAKLALVNMAFNLGTSRLLGFKNMIKALYEGDFALAATEALDSKWAGQVGARAFRIAQLYRSCHRDV